MVQTMSENPGGSTSPDYRNAKADAKAAKAYAKASRPWYKKKRWWAAGVLLIIIIASAGGAGSDSGSDESSNGGGGSESNGGGGGGGGSQSADMKVQATKIIKDFEENEAAADGRYKDKTLQVSGVVDKVDTEVWDDEEYVVRVGGGGQFELLTVNCNDLSSGEVSSIKKGQDIVVVGEFDDGGDLGVELKDCSIK